MKNSEMPPLAAKPAPKLEVTAVSPSSGRSKLLAHDELKQLFSLLTGYEEAQHQDDRASSARQSQAAALNQLAHKFHIFGINIDWFSDRPREDQPLFVAKFGPFEKSGYRLKDLLGIAREAGILAGTPQAPKNSEPRPGKPGDKRIFVVDDDESVRDMLAFAVRNDGFQAEAFADGIEMMRSLQERPHECRPDLILLDLMLPIKGGYEILQQLQMEETKRIPIIVITGRDIDRDMSRVMRQEVNLREFIQKPIYPKVLLATIHKILKTSAPAKVAVS